MSGLFVDPNHVLFVYYLKGIKSILVNLKRKRETIFTRTFISNRDYFDEGDLDFSITPNGSKIAIFINGEFYIYDIYNGSEIFYQYFPFDPRTALARIRGTSDSRYFHLYIDEGAESVEFFVIGIKERKVIEEKRDFPQGCWRSRFSDNLLHHVYLSPLYDPIFGIFKGEYGISLDKQFLGNGEHHEDSEFYFSRNCKYLTVTKGERKTTYDVETKKKVEPTNIKGSIAEIDNDGIFRRIPTYDYKMTPSKDGYLVELDYDRDYCFHYQDHIDLTTRSPHMLAFFCINCTDYNPILAMMPSIRTLYSLQRSFPLFFPDGVLEHVVENLIDNPNRDLVRFLLNLAGSKTCLSKRDMIKAVILYL